MSVINFITVHGRRRSRLLSGIFPVILLCLAMAAPLSAGGPDHRAETARGLVKTFAGELGMKLKTALGEGGAVEAIRVCNVVAPDIADRLSTEHDWHIARTSLQPRNTDNAPDDWEAAVLRDFDERLRNGEAIKDMEYFAEVATEDGTLFRYMKPIPTQGLCLTCHGSDIDPVVQSEISRLYPDDRATGYRMGDIRGAFTLSRLH